MFRKPIGNADLSGGIPKKKSESSRDESRAYRMGWVAANLTLERQRLEQEKAQASAELAGIMQTLMAKQAEQQMALQQQQYQGSYDATNQHLQGYSDQLASMLNTPGGGQPQAQQPMPQQQGF